jgi:integrase
LKRVVILDETRRPILREGGKTVASRRTISITPELAERLRRHKVLILEQKVAWGPEYAGGPMLCFPAIGGASLPPQLLANKLRLLLGRAGIKGAQPLHIFRHTHASWLMAARTNPKAISERLGHRNVAFTLATYTHPTREEDRATAALMQDLIKR